MQKMHISFVKDLKNYEFCELFHQLSNALTSQGVEDKQLKQVVGIIQKHHHKLLLIRDTKPRHRLTEIINAKVRSRTEYLACLRLKIEANLLSPIHEERIAAKRLKLWMSPYRKDIFKPTISTQGRLIKFLIADREESADIQAFTTLLHLNQLLEIVEGATTEINTLYHKRANEINQQSVSSKKIREAAYKDFQLLINVMEVTYRMSNSDEGQAQIAELSQTIAGLLKSFHTPLKSRNTKSRNKKEINIAVEELVDVTQKPAKTNSISNLPVMIYDSLIVDDRGKDVVSKLYKQIFNFRGSE